MLRMRRRNRDQYFCAKLKLEDFAGSSRNDTPAFWQASTRPLETQNQTNERDAEINKHAHRSTPHEQILTKKKPSVNGPHTNHNKNAPRLTPP